MRRLAVLLLAAVLAFVAAGTVSVTPAAAQTPLMAVSGTGTGGSFVPAVSRLVDTRNGTGGYATPLAAGAWRSYQVAGVGAVPASGAASVVVTITSLTPASAGNASLAPNTSLPATPLVFLQFDGGDTVSNTGVVDIGTDGKIAVRSGISLNVLIDVQGYFTVGNGTAAPGGYVSAHQTRIVDTRIAGTGLPQGKVAVNSTSTILATGGGIPASATAVYANITVLTTSSTDNYVTPYPTGQARPPTSMNYTGVATAGTTAATALGATIDLNSAGQFDLYVGSAGGSIDVLVDIQGYFDGEPSTSGFTPVSSRIYDSRVAPAVALPANSVTTVRLGGVGGIPAASTSLAGVALNVLTLGATTEGNLRVWPGDQPEPDSSAVNYVAADHSSSLTVVQPSLADGTIKISNHSYGTVNVVLDAEGYFTNPSVLPPAIGAHPTCSGSRAAQSVIKRTLTDRSGVQVNTTNGDLLYSQSLLSLAGVGQSATVGLRYNALNDNRPTMSAGLFEAQLAREGSSGIVTYTGPDGAGYVFTPATGTGSSYSGNDAAGNPATLYRYVQPVGVNADLVRVGATYGPGTEYDLTFHPSQTVNVYADNGSNITLNSSQDVTGANKISYAYARAHCRRSPTPRAAPSASATTTRSTSPNRRRSPTTRWAAASAWSTAVGTAPCPESSTPPEPRHFSLTTPPPGNWPPSPTGGAMSPLSPSTEPTDC